MLTSLKQLLNRPVNPAIASHQPQRALTRADLEHVQALVVEFLTAREIPDFKVTVRQGGTWQILVMVEALPCQNLRHSNLMEFDIRRIAESRLGLVIGPVFWRFMIGDQGEAETLHEAVKNHQVSYVERTQMHPLPPDPASPTPAQGTPPAALSLSEHYSPGDTLDDFEVTELSLQDMHGYLAALERNQTPTP